MEEWRLLLSLKQCPQGGGNLCKGRGKVFGRFSVGCESWWAGRVEVWFRGDPSKTESGERKPRIVWMWRAWEGLHLKLKSFYVIACAQAAALKTREFIPAWGFRSR